MLVEVEYQITGGIDGEAGRDVVVVVDEQVGIGEAEGVATGAALKDEVESLPWRIAGERGGGRGAGCHSADRERVGGAGYALIDLELDADLTAGQWGDVDLVDGHGVSGGLG